MKNKKPSIVAKNQTASGMIELMEFDPRLGCGEVVAAVYSVDGKLLDDSHRLKDAGGVMIWDGDLRSMGMINRYLAKRAEIIARCPQGYPIPSVILMTPKALPRRIKRVQSDNAIKLADYVMVNKDKLDNLFISDKRAKDLAKELMHGRH